MTDDIIDEFFEKVEEYEEDIIIIVLIVFSVAIFIGAFAALNTDIAQSAEQEASVVAQRLSDSSFLQRLDYMGSIFFPWILMLASMIIAREIWLYRVERQKSKES